MTDRERFVNCCLGEPVDRPPYWLNWGPWPQTMERWQSEGCPFADWGQVRRHFGAESPPQTVNVNYGPFPQRWETIRENDEEIVYRDNWGINRRNFKKTMTMSEFLEFPVKNREDWEQFKAERLDPNHPGRFTHRGDQNKDWVQEARGWMDQGFPIQIGCYPDVTLFGGVRWLLGDEECLLAFYTMPDLVHDIMEHLTNLYLHIFQRIVDEGIRVDVVHIWEDMSGRQGPLISPAHFREFMTPRYQRIKAFAVKNHIPLMSVDTDGNPDLIVPPMMAGGVNYLWPMEVAAGADVCAFQKKYPSLAMMGGFDKRAAAAGPAAIDAEIERLRPAVQAGRYIPEYDHLIPNDTSWANICYYAEAMKKLVGKK